MKARTVRRLYLAITVSSCFAMTHGIASDWRAPQTPYGTPDLQGLWDYSSRTAMERHPRFEGRLAINQEELTRLVPTYEEYIAALEASGAEAPGEENVGGYNGWWIAPGDTLHTIDGLYRTSLIIDPPDGRIPSLENSQQVRAEQRARYSINAHLPESDGPEGRTLADRCLTSFASTVPFLPTLYNNTMQIVQTPGYVMLLAEMVHDARVVKIGGSHDDNALRQWYGHSVGYYEGDTLVVETRGFHPQQIANSRYHTENVTVTERFSRNADDTLLYQFTIEDPDLYSAPWTGELPMTAAESLYEYACHEGNHAMPGILAGARVQELEAAAAAN